MSETGGLDIGMPDEGGGGASEQLSEEAKQRFAASAAAAKKSRKQEKKSKKKDDKVADIIRQFLNKKKYSHFFVLVSRLVGRDCPSIFILAVLSLIHEDSLTEVQAYLKDTMHKDAHETVDDSMALTTTGDMDAQTSRTMIDWITRLQMVLATDPEKIMLKLMLDDKNIDGTVLQLTTFVLQDFFKQNGRAAPFEKIQPLTASILQAVFEPFIGSVKKVLLKSAEDDEEDDE